MIKHCNLCNSDKTIDNFYKGLSYCKECHKINRNNYYKNNKNKKIKYALDYRKNNIDKVRNIVVLNDIPIFLLNILIILMKY